MQRIQVLHGGDDSSSHTYTDVTTSMSWGGLLCARV